MTSKFMVWIPRSQVWKVIPVATLTESSHWAELPVWTELPGYPRLANRKELSQSLRDRWGNGSYKIRVFYYFPALKMSKATKNFVRQFEIAAESMKEFVGKLGKLAKQIEEPDPSDDEVDTDFYNYDSPGNLLHYFHHNQFSEE